MGAFRCNAGLPVCQEARETLGAGPKAVISQVTRDARRGSIGPEAVNLKLTRILKLVIIYAGGTSITALKIPDKLTARIRAVGR